MIWIIRSCERARHNEVLPKAPLSPPGQPRDGFDFGRSTMGALLARLVGATGRLNTNHRGGSTDHRLDPMRKGNDGPGRESSGWLDAPRPVVN
jgi:hypothetical protein